MSRPRAHEQSCPCHPSHSPSQRPPGAKRSVRPYLYDQSNSQGRPPFNVPSATPYTANFTAPGGNLLQPPSSIVTDIITAVPATVLALLMIPARRSSISSEIQAGNTPGWYESLPAEVKSHVSAMKEQVSRGDVDLNATRTPPPTTTASEIEEESDDEDSPATEASTGLGSRTTGEMATLAGALGVLGLATAL